MDGPYIFIKKKFFEINYIGTSIHINKGEVQKKKFSCAELENYSFHCATNTAYGEPTAGFSFGLSSNEDFNSPCEYSMPEKIIAISDIEGNFYALQSILIAHKVIDKKNDWMFGAGHLVLPGDLIDRSNNVLACLWLIYKLEVQAKEQGGAVHYLLGNHELMNFKNDLRYVHPQYTSSMKVKELYKALFSTTSVLGNWIRSKNTIERIGNYLFVHGGISTQLLQYQFTMQQINHLIQENLSSNISMLNEGERMLFGMYGPLWYRGLVYQNGEDDKVTEDNVDEVLQYFNVKKMVIGHTVVPFYQKLYNGKVIAIDILQPNKKGNTTVQAILIEGEHEYIIDDRGGKQYFNV
ncbi:MAG TPA: metallophosphoesterase [Chitinophagaceae bacterium]|nr:metallophosphoesterase [Chitinophagaceae bacterium]